MNDARFPRAVCFSIINISIIIVLMLATFPDSGQCSISCVPGHPDSCKKAANEDNNNCCCMDDLQNQKGQLSCDCHREVNSSDSDVKAECLTLPECQNAGADCAGVKKCCDALCVNDKHCMMAYLNASTSQCFLFDNLVHQASQGEVVSVKKCTRSSAGSINLYNVHLYNIHLYNVQHSNSATVLVVCVLVILVIRA